ncbi:hypothetical protein XH98_08615 [Bradyrhizobium sp. CCBAU 51745]|uniref:GNAT family N-acetyltransferase n=1 Tax=Bradyrhizobium sp. CCBAU 51745 TaxID=1325099 RepID=UPI003FA4B07C|nr:hypothetical protein [Bradyrhizobium sp. CCBAU 51745]
MIQIRRACDSDAVWLIQLVTEPSFNRWMGGDAQRGELLALAVRKKLELHNVGRGCVLIAQDQTGPLGYGAYLDSISTGYSYVEYGVTPSKFRRGIGGSILDALIASARQSGSLGLQTLCHPENVASIKLLLSRGFERSAFAHDPTSFKRYTLSYAFDSDDGPSPIEGIPPSSRS